MISEKCKPNKKKYLLSSYFSQSGKKINNEKQGFIQFSNLKEFYFFLLLINLKTEGSTINSKGSAAMKPPITAMASG